MRGDQRKTILDALSAGPRCSYEIAEAVGIATWLAASRCSDMCKEGILRRHGFRKVAKGGRITIWEIGDGTRPPPMSVRQKPVGQSPTYHAALQHPASLTAAIFGDPTPGRSALDQRMGELT